MGFEAPGAPQTPKMDDLRPAPEPPNRRDGAGKAGPGTPKNSPTFLANCCFWNSGWGTGPGTLTLLNQGGPTKKVSFLRGEGSLWI